jgi:hypothetical protein
MAVDVPVTIVVECVERRTIPKECIKFVADEEGYYSIDAAGNMVFYRDPKNSNEKGPNYEIELRVVGVDKAERIRFIESPTDAITFKKLHQQYRDPELEFKGRILRSSKHLRLINDNDRFGRYKHTLNFSLDDVIVSYDPETQNGGEPPDKLLCKLLPESCSR